MNFKLIDIDGLLHRTMNDPEFAREILDDYLTETPEMISRLQKAVELSDIKFIKIFSHKLKGASASVGAVEIKKQSELIEKMSDKAEIIKITNTITGFLELYYKTIQTIKNLEIMK